MKTSVTELQFDWTDPYTGEYPKTYVIRVEGLGSGNRCGDLKSRYLIKLLSEYGDQVLNFPKTLMEEVYDDCCRAVTINFFSAPPDNYMIPIRQGYADPSTMQKITDIMFLRCGVYIDAYLDCTGKDESECFFESDTAKCKCNLKESCEQCAEKYAETGDWILDLSDQADLVKTTLILLNLRKDIWQFIPKKYRDKFK